MKRIFSKEMFIQRTLIVIATLAAFFVLYERWPILAAQTQELFAGTPESSAAAGSKAIISGDVRLAEPIRLQIRSIGVDAAVQRVGKNSSGALQTPSNFTDAAWYKLGPKPGEIGNAIIDGHVDNGLGLRGVFTYLGKLKPGDLISTTDASGTVLSFKVAKVGEYDGLAEPPSEVFGPASDRRLTLVTCAGRWVKGAGTDSLRLVVVAELEGIAAGKAAVPNSKGQ